MPWLIGLGALVVIIVIWAIATYNGLVGLKNRLDESFSTIDVYLKRRYDLIPNLVETVKGYTSHERETLERVIAARGKAVNAPAGERVQAEQELGSALRSLLAVVENYPDLKADTQFTQLQAQLNQVELDLAQARKYYNAVVKQFNTRVQQFPAVIIANMFRFEKAPFFEIEDQAERQNVRVSF